MTDRSSFTIVGTGAVGGYYGALLQRAGFDVRFLLHNDYEHVRGNGLVVETCKGNFQVAPVQAYNDPRRIPRSDVVIVALKTTANAMLPAILPYVLKPDGVVLTLQNGLGSEDEIAVYVDQNQIIGGLCFLCSNKIGPGHIRQLDYGLITLGEYRADGTAGGITPRLRKISATLQDAGIAIQLEEDLLLARWKKLVWNIPFNGLSVLHNTLTDKLVQNPDIRSHCKALMKEVATASEACARPIEDSFIEKMMINTEKMKPYAPSMKLDFERGNPMEIESIYGNPIRTANTHGVSMPATEEVYRRLLDLSPVV